MTTPASGECEYVLCQLDPAKHLRGPDGVYAFCAHHAQWMVERSPNFDWRGDSV